MEETQIKIYQFKEENLKEETYRFLTDNGFSHIQACAVMAEIKMESDFDCIATASEDFGYGILQWGGVRKENLDEFADSQGKKSSDYEIQLLFLMEEVNPESKYYAKLDKYSYSDYEWTDFLGATNPRDAAKAFCMVYARPVRADLKLRGDIAEQYYRSFCETN